jgi:hypothetical protein
MSEDYLAQPALASQARQIAGHFIAPYLERTFEGANELATSKISANSYDHPRIKTFTRHLDI